MKSDESWEGGGETKVYKPRRVVVGAKNEGGGGNGQGVAGQVMSAPAAKWVIRRYQLART